MAPGCQYGAFWWFGAVPGCPGIESLPDRPLRLFKHHGERLVSPKRKVQKEKNKSGQPKVKENCVECGKDFIGGLGRIYCSKVCIRSQVKNPFTDSGIPTGTRGSISELIVSVRLMTKGWHVFRALSPACPCDLIAMRGLGESLLLEIRTGTFNKRTGTITFSKRATDNCHVYVVSDGSPNGKIHLEPGPLSSAIELMNAFIEAAK